MPPVESELPAPLGTARHQSSCLADGVGETIGRIRGLHRSSAHPAIVAQTGSLVVSDQLMRLPLRAVHALHGD